MSLITPSGSAGVPLSIPSIGAATAPIIANLAMPVAGTEYSYTFPTGTRKFSVKARLRDNLQYSYTAGQSGTTFITIPNNNWGGEEDLLLTAPRTLYIQSATQGGQTLEVLYWT